MQRDTDASPHALTDLDIDVREHRLEQPGSLFTHRWQATPHNNPGPPNDPKHPEENVPGPNNNDNNNNNNTPRPTNDDNNNNDNNNDK